MSLLILIVVGPNTGPTQVCRVDSDALDLLEERVVELLSSPDIWIARMSRLER